MKLQSIPVVLLAAVLLLGSGASLAADKDKASATPSAASLPKKTQQNKKPKPIDINRASAAQLKTVPSIGDAEAQRIIKGRPYPTKAHLVTENILTYEAYLAVKDRFVAIPVGRPKPNKP